ncbi:MAG: DUF87 domain-containing protein [Lutibacter sp.]|jgi:GTPase SAR1 family protein
MNKGGSHLITGATGTGKTTFIRSLLNKVNSEAVIVYDINAEYTDFFPYPFIEFENFTTKLKQINNGIIVLEEATIFLNNRGTNHDVTELLVRKRHTHNYIILVFHSMRSIPRWIYELSNYITIFKTNDSPQLTARELKDNRIEDIMTSVRNEINPHFHTSLKIY